MTTRLKFVAAGLQERVFMNLPAVALLCAHDPYLRGGLRTSRERVQKITNVQ